MSPELRVFRHDHLNAYSGFVLSFPIEFICIIMFKERLHNFTLRLSAF
jgi:hypothetical protein